MNREVHVRFWERPEVKLLRATRHSRRFDYLTATSALPRTTDISDRPGMSESATSEPSPRRPKVNLAHPAGLAYDLPDNQ